MRGRTCRALLVVGVAAVLGAACQPAKPLKPPLPPGPEVEIQHADGWQPGAQDVWWLDGDDLRNPDGATPDDAALFNIAGAPLDLTWGEYHSVAVQSVAKTVRSEEPYTEFHVRLDGLVPNGVYSIFYATLGPDSMNPHCPGVLRDLPVTTLWPWNPPDESSFVADASGSIRYVGWVDGTPMDSTQVTLQVIYHADGQTYHPLPNRAAFETQGPSCTSSYGVDAMRQVFILQKWIF